MKNKLSFKFAVWWVVLFAVLGVFLLIVSDKNERESDEENRMLAGFPQMTLSSVADASFMDGFENFMSDAFFGRASIKNFTSRVTGVFNALSQDDKMEQKAKDLEKQLAEEGAADEEFEPIPAEEETESDVDIPTGARPMTASTSYMWLKKLDGSNKNIYSYSASNVNTYAQTLRMMLNYMSSDGQIYFTQTPVADIAHRWTNQTDVYCGWGSTMEDMLESAVSNSRIHIFNVPEILEQPLAKDEYVYYLTDHHWTTYGAYLVAKAILEYQGIPIVPYDEYNYKYLQSARDSEGNQDTFDVLYPLLPTHSLVITRRTVGEEISLMNYNHNTYRALMNNSRQPWRRITTGVNVGRRALIISDSYGNAFAPYLLPYYDEVHMVDFRKGYYDISKAGGTIGEMMQYYQIDDVYVVISSNNDLRKDNSIIYLRQYLAG